jgi:hypothetical protein
MYDTINFWLSSDKVNSFNISDTSRHLVNISESFRDDGQNLISGNIKNLKVSMRLEGISIKGSLAKYFLNDNFKTLTRLDTQRAIEQLSDELYLPIHEFNITRLDFAQNMLMEHPPEAYYNFLGDCIHYTRLKQPQSIYYSNGLKQKLFYNKIAEGRKKRETIPEIWNDRNVLRYEMRYLNRLPKQFNTSMVTAQTITDEKFYMTMFDNWHNEYNSINKINDFKINTKEMKSPKDFKKQLEIFAIKQLGQDNLFEMIESLRLQNTFESHEYYSRLKKEIRTLCRTPEITIETELIKELNKKIDNTKRNYR